MPTASILVVEDEFIVAQDLAQRLEALGYRVAGTAASGERALELAAAQAPDLALMDISLRGEMDGLATAQALRRRHDIPSVFVTARMDHQRLSQAKQALPLGYLLKPFQSEELAVTLEMALHAARAERAQRRSEERFRRIVENANEGIWELDHQGRTTFANQRLADMLGHRPEELVGRPFTDFIDGEAVARAEQLFQRRAQGVAEQHEFTFRRRDGSELPCLVSASPFLGPEGEFSGVVGLITDLGRLKQAEAEARRSEARFRELWESIADLVYTQDLEGRFTSLNPALARILGYRQEELIGRPASDFMKPEVRQSFRDDYLASVRERGEHQGVGRYFHRDGGKRYLEYRSQLVTPREGDPYITGMARDVTERVLQERRLRQLREQLQQSQKMEALGTLAGGIAHDFNNILGAVLGYAELARDAAAEGQPLGEELGQIMDAAERARELVRQILTFSRKVEAELKPLDLNAEARRAAELLRHTLPREIELETRLAEGLPPVSANANQLQQVLLNLASNAADAMPEGGRLEIATAAGPEGEPPPPGLEGAPGRLVRLEVTDTGQGMDRAVCERIFDPFFTTKDPGRGTGLGLATVYGIVKAHGAHIACASQPGRGSRFTITLPAQGQAPRQAPAAKAGPGLPAGSETVLLVDDEPTLLDLGAAMLRRAGYRPLTARRGEEALELCRSRPGEVELVVLDLSMPGMGGQQCLEELRRLRPGLPVLIASGYLSDHKVHEALAAGASDFVAKPFTRAELLRKVRELLDARAGDQPRA
jgi:PAS domain S-box-containing protein